ncbi:imidazolonepropionase [Luteibacter sp. UNC138MFCol5.1]|uniref:imidazolonepropionase n=1 Tax=Luteibacter sp. UNC138MFCol5.1 TaxID=1502774 RepID=UPI0008C320D1|nr:imidazolonepropionase [Luteibacter sp. UNC138MFCol5.1]SEO56417.1 imidazolonepropionase [Luteibacter sp. UNC138MFCol5.1]
MTDDTRWDHLLVDVSLATMRDDGAPCGAIEGAAIGWRDDRIAFAGPMSALPGDPHALARHVESLPGTWVTPGLIDCHTHLVFGGDRATEFERRLEGATYEEIALAGGGIVSSVRATRAANEDELLRQSLPRARALLADGVTTLEIKSGYGLEPDAERRMLRVARRIGEVLGVDVRTTFLGLHALPPEYAGRRDEYVALVCDIMLPSLADEELVDAVDAFCEGIGFTHAETQRLFEKATALGLPVKLHAEQLSDLGGAALVARYNGLSADHLEWTSEDGVHAMAAAGTVAVLLPGAYYALRDTRPPPVGAFRDHGVAMAVATDLNPGTSPLLSLRLAMNMACTLFRLTPEEALRGTTVNAARALGLDDRGVLAPGKRADIAVWNVKHLPELCYWIGGSLLRDLWIAGERVAT